MTEEKAVTHSSWEAGVLAYDPVVKESPLPPPTPRPATGCLCEPHVARQTCHLVTANLCLPRALKRISIWAQLLFQ